MHSDGHHEHHHHDQSEAVDSATPGVSQAICPVTGDVVNRQEAEDAGHIRHYNGKQYYLCCSTCIQLFDKAPEQYTGSHTHLGHEHHHIPTSGALRLKEKEHLVDNVWAFRFEPEQPLTWIAGQFIRVELPHENPDEEGEKRWFTVSSAPYEGIVQITTRVTHSTFKQALERLPIGGELHLIEKPDGDFVWKDTGKEIVFVAGGIGITPFRSILKQRHHDRQPLDVTLIYANRTDDIVFKNEFDAYDQTDSNLKVEYVVDEPLTVEKLSELVPKLKSSLVYVSGPEPMVETLGDKLRLAGLPENQLKQDFFPNYTEANY